MTTRYHTDIFHAKDPLLKGVASKNIGIVPFTALSLILLFFLQV